MPPIPDLPIYHQAHVPVMYLSDATLFMNILIENNDTLEYFTATGQWTKDPLDAKCFPAAKAAFRVAKQEAINKFNIVFHIAGTNQFVNLDHGRGTGLSESSSE